MTNEIFKPHPVHQEYLISNLGTVIGIRGKPMKPCALTGGYRGVGVSIDYKDGNRSRKTISRTVHKLVVETFIGPVPKALQIDHINGDKTDNRLCNLEIVTCSTNNKRAYDLGLKKGNIGIENGRSKLTESHILEIYNLIMRKKTNSEIAALYHVHERYVSLVRHGKRWAYLFANHAISKLSDTDRMSNKKNFSATTIEKICQARNA